MKRYVSKSNANNEHLLHLGSANFGKNCEERLFVPASSASSERVFSQYKLATPTTHNRHTEERIQQLMIIKTLHNGFKQTDRQTIAHFNK
jgi:hypothetical protein